MADQQYPTQKQLKTIRNWEIHDTKTDFPLLMEYVKELWAFGAWGWSQEGEIYRISTGGWSGNEDLIDALKKNVLFWMMFWQSTVRGGHYVFAPMTAEIIFKLHERCVMCPHIEKAPEKS